MRTALVIWVCLTLWAGHFALAQTSQAGEQVLLKSMIRWSDLPQQSLNIPGAPRPSSTVVAAFDGREFGVSAVFGSLLWETDQRVRPARLEVVVGDDQLNSSRFAGALDSVNNLNLVVEDVPLAIERDLWIAADRSYKAAVNRYQIKKMAMTSQGGKPPPPDWSPAPPVFYASPRQAPPIDAARLKQLVIQASGRLRALQGLRHGQVEAYATSGNYLLVTSTGTRLVQPEGFVAIHAWAELLRPDGVKVKDHREWLALKTADLPDDQTIMSEVELMGRSVVERATAPIDEYYEGPVMFEGEAAADFFRYLASPELSGTPATPRPTRTYEQLNRDGPRLGRRLLPPGWSIVDDPGLASASTPNERRIPGAYLYDREGVLGQAVDLVVDGYVRSLLMTRVPRTDLRLSNGHARGSVKRDWPARLSIWEVTPNQALDEVAMRARVDQVLRDGRKNRLLVIKRLSFGAAGSLPRPSLAVWRDAQGAEQPLASLEFQRVDRRTLRDIVAASGRQVHPYLASFSRVGQAMGTNGIPSTLIAPSQLLIGEMEAVFPGPDEKPNLLPPPTDP